MYKRHTYRIIVLILMLATAIGCRRDDTTLGTEGKAAHEPASLVLTTDINALITPQGTRTYDADDNTIRHVALFLINYMDNRLVAYRTIYPGASDPYNDIDDDNGFINEATGSVDKSLTSGKKIRVTFDYDNPKHGAAEKLTRGSYMLLAVANFSESDQFGNSGIATQIRSLIDRFREDPDNGISDFRGTCQAFYDLQLRIPEKEGTGFPYIRPRNVSIPLTSTLILNLISGQNHASAELKHTSARVRVELCNYSDVPLTVSNLSFSNNFTQSTCYLFSRTDGENYTIENDYHGKGAPIATDNNAITSFTPNVTINKETGVVTLFDGLIYESRDLEHNYTYTLDVTYEDEVNNYVLKNSGQSISNPSEISTHGPYFLIRRSSVASYLYVDNDKVYASTGNYTPQEILDRCRQNSYYYNYVWELVPTESGYRLRNVQTGDYIEGIRYNNRESEADRLRTTGEPGADTFTIETANGSMVFRSNYYNSQSGSSGNAYINTRGSNHTLVVGWNGNGDWSQFSLYPLAQQTKLSASHEVVLRTIDKTSGVVSDVHEIARNDYIRILVEASYNPDKGDFDFIVNGWETGGGDITFN